jgi:hypothetical protein
MHHLSPVPAGRVCSTPVLFSGFTAVVAMPFRATQDGCDRTSATSIADDHQHGADPSDAEHTVLLPVAGLNQGSDLIVITA